MSRWPNVTWPDWLDMDPAPAGPVDAAEPDRNGSGRDRSTVRPAPPAALEAPTSAPGVSEPIDVVARPRSTRPVTPPLTAVPDAPAAVRARLLSIVPPGWSPALGNDHGLGRAPATATVTSQVATATATATVTSQVGTATEWATARRHTAQPSLPPCGWCPRRPPNRPVRAPPPRLPPWDWPPLLWSSGW